MTSKSKRQLRIVIPSIVVGVAVSLSGCMTTGSQTVAVADAGHVNQYIIDGKTTLPEVRAIYGEPSAISDGVDGGGLWYYSSANNRLIKAQVKTLGVWYNAKQIVTRHAFQDTDAEKAAQGQKTASWKLETLLKR